MSIKINSSAELNLPALVKTYILFLFLALLIHFNSFQNQFMMDDIAYSSNPINSNIKYASVHWNPYYINNNILVDSNSQGVAYYRPLMHMVGAFCYTYFKQDMWKYHLFNLFFYVLGAFLLYLCIAKISKSTSLAFLSIALYLIHPINGIVVNYKLSSSLVFLVIFLSASILLLWESIQNNEKRSSYFLSLFCFIPALLFHETAVMLPFYAASVLVLASGLSRKKIITTLIPYFLILLNYLMFRYFFVSNDFSLPVQASSLKSNLFEIIATIYSMLAWYIGKLFYPIGIVVMYALSIVKTHVALLNLGFCALVFLCMYLLVYFRKNKMVQVGLIWFYIGLIPAALAIFLKSIDSALIEPHWFVFSVIGFFILVAHCFLTLWSKLGRWWTGFLLFIVAVSWVQLSHGYNRLWHDQKNYCAYWLKESPFLSLPLQLLSYSYFGEGQFDDAFKLTLKQLSGKESDFIIYKDLGVIEMKRKNYQNAELYFKKSIAINPSYIHGYLCMALLKLESGEKIKSREYFLKVQRIDPDNLYFLLNYIGFLATEKDDQYINLSKRYIALNNNARDLTRFGVFLSDHFLYELAFESLEKSFKIDPDNEDVYIAVGITLANEGKLDEAIHWWNLGLKIKPNDPRFKENITKAMALKKSGI